MPPPASPECAPADDGRRTTARQDRVVTTVSARTRRTHASRAAAGRGPLARPGHAAARAASTPGSPRPCSAARSRTLPVRVVLPGRPGARLRRQARPGHAAGPAGQRVRPAGRRREDRLRRGVHDRRLDHRPGHRPRRPARARSPPGCPAWSTPCCSGCGTWSSAPSRRTRRTARRTAATNISRHYDLSNELFEPFLDETMTYSSALVRAGRRPGRPPSAARWTASWTSPASGPGMHVLEIGSGWGALAIRAAQRARRPGHHADAVHRAAGAGPAAGRRRRRRPPGRRPAAGLPRRDRAATTRSCRWR